MESVSPPPTSRRRWRQYSLRTLLSLMLVVSVACAWLAAKRESKRAESQIRESRPPACGG
jgi:DNA-binding FadR family transcriptional regulator